MLQYTVVMSTACIDHPHHSAAISIIFIKAQILLCFLVQLTAHRSCVMQHTVVQDGTKITVC